MGLRHGKGTAGPRTDHGMCARREAQAPVPLVATKSSALSVPGSPLLRDAGRRRVGALLSAEPGM